jgi:hypothetical protein
MPSYLVETFLARSAADQRLELDRRVAEAAEALTRLGTRVRFGGSVHVPDDETCFFTFDAATVGAAALAAERAGLRALRVVEAIATPDRSLD